MHSIIEQTPGLLFLNKFDWYYWFILGDDIFLNLTAKKEELELNITHEQGINSVIKEIEKLKEEPSATLPGNVPNRPTDRYVPAFRRANGVPGSYGEEMLSVKISNISLDTTEDDLHELLNNFGRIQRLHMPKDRMRGQSKGVAFVTFHNKEAATEVVKKLNGYAYDHLILKTEWSKPQIKRNV